MVHKAISSCRTHKFSTMKYSPHISVVFICLFLLSCKEQKAVVPDNVKYEFIHFIMHSDEPINLSGWKFVADKDTSQLTISEADSINFVSTVTDLGIFRKDDAVFMWKQIADYSDFTLSSSEIKDRTIISPGKWRDLPHEKYWDYILKKYETDKFYSLSMPLFSKDLLTVIISIEDYGMQYGKRAGSYVYKKSNGKWTFLKQLSYVD